MDFHGKLWGYFYALTLSLWSVFVPLSASTPSVVDAQEITSEKVSSYDQPDLVLTVNHSSPCYLNCFRTAGDSPNIHFFNEGDFQFVFLQNIYATAYSILKAGDINFEFIDLIYPFHYFW